MHVFHFFFYYYDSFKPKKEHRKEYVYKSRDYNWILFLKNSKITEVSKKILLSEYDL